MYKIQGITNFYEPVKAAPGPYCNLFLKRQMKIITKGQLRDLFEIPF
jgi:hypothetical protein